MAVDDGTASSSFVVGQEFAGSIIGVAGDCDMGSWGWGCSWGVGVAWTGVGCDAFDAVETDFFARDFDAGGCFSAVSAFSACFAAFAALASSRRLNSSCFCSGVIVVGMVSEVW